MYLVDGVIRGVFGAVWALPRLLEANIGEVQLGRYTGSVNYHTALICDVGIRLLRHVTPL